MYIFIIINNNNTILEINNKNSRLDCLHRTYEKAQAKRNKVKKIKVFKVKKTEIKAELGEVYQKKEMKELVKNLVSEFKSIQESKKLSDDVVDIYDFLSKDYKNNYIVR